MVNGFRYYRALAGKRQHSVSSVYRSYNYTCQIRVHQRRQSKLQLPPARKKGVAAGHSGQFTPCGYLSTLWYTLLLLGLEPATFRSLVDCWSDALPIAPPTHRHRQARGKNDCSEPAVTWSSWWSSPVDRWSSDYMLIVDAWIGTKTDILEYVRELPSSRFHMRSMCCVEFGTVTSAGL